MIVLEGLFLTISPCDAAEPWQLGFQDAATPMMQGIIDLHHDIFFFLILILVFVLWILVRALWHFHYQKNPIPQRIVHGTTIEILRTIFPSIIPMFIAIPSFALLYSMDEVVVDPAITIKAIGHQWYRTYEYSDYNSSDEQSLTFDSYTIPEDDLELGQLRLLEVDNRVVVPAKTHLRIIVTSADVLHSWAVPSLGVKCDAVPGRLNQISILVQREGVYYGQCSEICGTNHAFTPIVVEAVPRKNYASRVSNQLMPTKKEGAEAILIAAPQEPPLIWCSGSSQMADQAGPSNAGLAHSPAWSFPSVPSDLSALPSDASVPSLPSLDSNEGEQSVNQREAWDALPANPVASRGEEAGPSNQPLPVEPYPYTDTEVIGGDSVSAIQRRLLEKYPSPSAATIERARIDAQDLFEVKVEIINRMADLDPQGDWMGRGARALENPRTATGDESFERLSKILEGLVQDGVNSPVFSQLKSKVFLRGNGDAQNSAS